MVQKLKQVLKASISGINKLTDVYAIHWHELHQINDCLLQPVLHFNRPLL